MTEQARCPADGAGERHWYGYELSAIPTRAAVLADYNGTSTWLRSTLADRGAAAPVSRGGRDPLDMLRDVEVLHAILTDEAGY